MLDTITLFERKENKMPWAIKINLKNNTLTQEVIFQWQ